GKADIQETAVRATSCPHASSPRPRRHTSRNERRANAFGSLGEPVAERYDRSHDEIATTIASAHDPGELRYTRADGKDRRAGKAVAGAEPTYLAIAGLVG